MPRLIYQNSLAVGQTVLLITICFDLYNVMNPIDWSSCKQKKVCYSSYGAEKLACADTDDRKFHDKSACLSIFNAAKFIHQVVVNSKGLFETLKTLHEGKDYRPRQTVQCIRDSFDSEEMNSLKWV